MPKARKMTSKEMYETLFATTLRDFLRCSPITGEETTQRELAQYLGVRPQTVSLYCTGESLPNSDTLLKIAEFFGVTADFMITGKRPENKPITEMLGLSEGTIQNMKLVKDGYFEDTPNMLAILDSLLGDKDFYQALASAAEWTQRKAEAPEAFQEYCEWKAARFMQDFLLEFFRRDHASIYDQQKGVNQSAGVCDDVHPQGSAAE